MQITNRSKRLREKNYYVVFVYFFLIFFCLKHNFCFAQNNTVALIELNEKKELKFQNFYFKALSQKIIGNYKKAISNLESCNRIKPGETSVFFELSKNYYALKKYFLAKEYINKGLNNEPENIWMLNHLVSILKKEKDFSKAIKAQKKIALIKPKHHVELVELYLLNNDTKNALLLLKKLERDQILPFRLNKLKQSLEISNISKATE